MPSRLATALLGLLVCAEAHAQTYDTATVIALADSVLRAEVRPRLYPHFSYDPDSYYEYRNGRGRSGWHELIARRRTRGRFVGTNVRFRFRHPEYEWVTGFASVRLDSLLAPVGPPYLDFLPAFLREGRPSDFISADSALTIARAHGLRSGLREPEARLVFDARARQYRWEVVSVYDERTWGTTGYHGDAEMVRIDPVTGAVEWRGEVQLARPDTEHAR